MSEWREQVLRHFTPQVSRLTLVADPDGLLTEEGILQGIRERGFEVIPFEDPVAFRYAYESGFRSQWDQDRETDLVVALRSASGSLAALPYDLLEAGRTLSFSLGEIFPNLSYPVVAALDTSYLDALYRAQEQYKPGTLGDNATTDFVLRHVFEVAAELIKQPVDLLRVLLRRHYSGQLVSPVLDDWLVQRLRENSVFAEWDLERIVRDRSAFLLFLQERWPAFVNRVAGSPPGQVAEEPAPEPLAVRGPRDLPFDHDDVRVYIDNLFLDGLLTPVERNGGAALPIGWVAVGVRSDPTADRRRRLNGLLDSIASSVPTGEARHQDWQLFASRWAELSVLLAETGPAASSDLSAAVDSLRGQVDATFTAWVRVRYAGLHNQPSIPPVMVHHIPRALAREALQGSRGRVALVLLDGLALDQWAVLRAMLLTQRPDLQFSEGPVFAWVPTTTAVSRQAAFSGKLPMYFPDSIDSTAKDGGHWSQFWREQGLTGEQIRHLGVLNESDAAVAAEVASDERVRALGLVIDRCDKIMHGMTLGAAGMQNQISQWASRGFLADLVNALHERDFLIAIASDHGNVEATGIGRPGEGALVESQGQRVMIYNDAALRAEAARRLTGSIEWPSIGLPSGFLPLLAPARSAFTTVGSNSVTHGGISLEELVVPYVLIGRRST